jgi:hypothetical protein
MAEFARVNHPDSLLLNPEPVAMDSSPVRDRPSEILKNAFASSIKVKG